MALTDRKMPIITDVNDTPSVEGDPSHPNGSLMCSQFNALIDNELTTIQTAVGTIPTTTDDLPEGTTNKYYSTTSVNTDFDTRLATKTTDDLTEGATNKYFADSLARTAISATVGTSGITYDNTTGVFDFSNVQAGISDLNSFTTDDLSEGTNNKYFSDALARGAITVTGNGTYDNTTGIITVNSGVDHVSFVNNGNGTHTMTVWGDAGETVNLGSTLLNDGATGDSVATQLITQFDYDALNPKDPNTLYLING